MLTRRKMLLVGMATAGTATVPSGLFAQVGFSLQDFLQLSSLLTGLPVSALNPNFARFIYAAYSERGVLDELAQLAADPAPESLPSRAADELVAAWYSGVVQTMAGPVMGNYHSALLWSTPGLHPAGVCGGYTGYWSEPPQA